MLEKKMFTASETLFYSCLLFGIQLGLIIYFYVRKRLNYWKERGIAYVKALPVFGSLLNVALMKKSEGQFITDVYREYVNKKIVGYLRFNCQPALVVRDPSIAHKILVKDFSHFAHNAVSDMDDEILKHNLFFQKDEIWRKNRAILTPAFTAGKVKASYSQILAVAEELIKYLKTHPTDNITANDVFLLYTGEVVARCVFSIDGKSFTDPDPIMKKLGRVMLHEGRFQAFAWFIMIYVPILRKIFNIRAIPQEAVSIFRTLINDVTAYRKKNEGSWHDLVEYLEEEKKDERTGYSDQDIVAGCVTFYFEAYETLTAVLSHVFYCLALNQEVQSKVRKEIEEAFKANNKTWTFETISDMHYLDSVILETHRIFPVSFGLQKVCTEDYFMDIGETKPVEIKKGVTVWIPTYAIHNDALYWEDPQTFKPERFFDNHHQDHIAKTKGTFLPFGDGPRMCIGIRAAQTIVKVALVHILHHFKVLPSRENDPEDTQLEFNPTSFSVQLKKEFRFKLLEIKH